MFCWIMSYPWFVLGEFPRTFPRIWVSNIDNLSIKWLPLDIQTRRKAKIACFVSKNLKYSYIKSNENWIFWKYCWNRYFVLYIWDIDRVVQYAYEKKFGNIIAIIKLFLPGATSTRVAHGGTSSQLILKIISSRWEAVVDDNIKYKHRITYSLRHYELKFFRTIIIIVSQQLLTGVPRYPHWCTKRKRKTRYY